MYLNSSYSKEYLGLSIYIIIVAREEIKQRTSKGSGSPFIGFNRTTSDHLCCSLYTCISQKSLRAVDRG